MPMPARAPVSSVFTGWSFIENFCGRSKFKSRPLQAEIALASFHRFD
jgi:hypothetical protein